MNQLASCFHKRKHHLGTYLYFEGEDAKEALVIRKGETGLLKVS